MKIFGRKNLFYPYLLALLLLAILPINGPGSTLNNNYVFSIRLDYLAHFVVLLPYFFLLKKPIVRDLKTLAFLGLAFLFASFTELIQYVIPYRAFNINDLVANWIGILLSFAFYFLISKGNDKSSQQLNG